MCEHGFYLFFFNKFGKTPREVNNWCKKVIVSCIVLAFSIADLFFKIWKILIV